MWKQYKKVARWLEWYINKPRNSSDCQETPEARRGREGFSSRDFRERTGLLTPWLLILISRIARQTIFCCFMPATFFLVLCYSSLGKPYTNNASSRGIIHSTVLCQLFLKYSSPSSVWCVNCTKHPPGHPSSALQIPSDLPCMYML